jgi:hypothetical protein
MVHRCQEIVEALEEAKAGTPLDKRLSGHEDILIDLMNFLCADAESEDHDLLIAYLENFMQKIAEDNSGLKEVKRRNKASETNSQKEEAKVEEEIKHHKTNRETPIDGIQQAEAVEDTNEKGITTTRDKEEKADDEEKTYLSKKDEPTSTVSGTPLTKKAVKACSQAEVQRSACQTQKTPPTA